MCLKVVSRTSNQKSHFWHVTNVQKNFDAILGEGSKIPKNIISVTGGTVSAKKLYPKKFCTKCTFCAKCTLPKKSFSKNNQIVWM